MISLIIVANGESQRFGQNKMLIKIGDEILIQKTINVFLNFSKISQIILVSNKEVFGAIQKNDIEMVPGGKTRAQSVKNGLEKVKNKFVMVHDGARPFVSKFLIDKIISELKEDWAIVPVLKTTSCLKQIVNEKITTVNREEFVLSQTPQAFETKLLKNAFQNFNENWLDDCQAIEENGGKIKFILGEDKNIKVTFIEDIN